MKSRELTGVLFGASMQYEAYYLCRFNLAAVLPLLIGVFTLTHSEAGALGSMIFISYALILVPAGILGDLVGPRVVITLGAVLSLAMNFLFSYSTSLPSMLVIQFMNGLGQGMAWGPLTRLMANWYPKERMSFIMSLLSVPSLLGPPTAFILAGYLASIYGWRSAFQVPAAILAATSLLFALHVRDSPTSTLPVPISKSNIMQVLRNREIWLVGVTYFALTGIIRGLLTWLPTFLVERMAMTLTMAAIIGGLLSLPGIPTMFLGTWISDVRLRGRKNIVIAASLLAPIPILILLPLTQNTILILVMIGSLFALLYSAIGLYFAYPSILLPKEQVGTASGFIDMLGYVGAFLGTLTIGFTVDAFKSYDPMFMILATMSIFGAAIISKVTS